MNEFELIDEILQALGDATGAPGVRVGPGDDSAVVAAPAGTDVVASIDTLIADVHFPAAAPAELVGYRALMVSMSDLAAMGADPGYALVALSLPQADPQWAVELARGLGAAAADCDVPIVGGNIARGPVCISVSVHGWVPAGLAITRAGAKPGDQVYVTGPLGAAAAALARGGLEDYCDESSMDDLARAYFRPLAQLTAGQRLRGVATAAIDVSDGLLQDLGHVCAVSGVAAELEHNSLPVAPGATVHQALSGGDDYELCFTCDEVPPELGSEAVRIGQIVGGSGVFVDGKQLDVAGYSHFAQ